MSVKDIAGLIPTMSSVALVSDNLKTVSKKKPLKTKDMVNMGVKNIVGVEMIKLQSQLVGGL